MGKGKRRYTNGYMIYGCSECNRGFKMYLEENLETGGPDHKPVPFTICCPFCSTPNCRDVSFKKIAVERRRITPSMPAFINNKGDSCGVPINLERATVEYACGPNAQEIMKEEDVRVKLVPILRSEHCKKIVREVFREFVEKYPWEKLSKERFEELSLSVRNGLIDHLTTAIPEYDTNCVTVNSHWNVDASIGIDVTCKYTCHPNSRGVIINNTCRREHEPCPVEV